MAKEPSPAMQLLEETLDCLVAAVTVAEEEVRFGFICPEGGNINISIRATTDGLVVSEIPRHG